MRRCFAFAAGDFYGLRESPRSGDFLVAADAGYLLCQSLGLAPDLLIGDFDSMDAPAHCVAHIERVPVRKDDTDAMLALKAGLSRGCDEFHIYGGAGGRRYSVTVNALSRKYWARPTLSASVRA